MKRFRMILGGAETPPAETTLEQLAQRIHWALSREASDKTELTGNHLDFCRHLFEARRRFKDATSFGAWLSENHLGKDRLDPQIRADALNLGRDLDAARQMLEAAPGLSLRVVFGSHGSSSAAEPKARRSTKDGVGVSQAKIELVRQALERQPNATHKELGEQLSMSAGSAARACRALGRHGRSESDTDEASPARAEPKNAAPKSARTEQVKRDEMGEEQILTAAFERFTPEQKISLTQWKERLQTLAAKKFQREFDARVGTEVRRRIAEADDFVRKDNAKLRIENLQLTQMLGKRARPGVFTETQFNKIRKCVSRDTGPFATPEERDEASALLNDNKKRLIIAA